MSQYPDLHPLFASSTMHVQKIENSLHFSNVITYDYVEAEGTKDSYYNFLKLSKNYDREVQLYWENLQLFLDKEVNLVNDREAFQSITHCNIYFRSPTQPFVQWVVNFKGTAQTGTNTYENEVDPESLTYPIYSLYVVHPPLKILSIESSMQFNVNKQSGIIEYYGEIGDTLEGFEKITFDNLVYSFHKKNHTNQNRAPPFKS